MCGSDDIVTDYQQGHEVCNNCGGVLCDQVIAEDRDFSRYSFNASSSSAHTQLGTNGTASSGRCVARVPEPNARNESRHLEFKSKIDSLVEHRGLSSAVKECAKMLSDTADYSSIRSKDVAAWAMIALGSECVIANHPIDMWAKFAKKPRHVILNAMRVIKPQVIHLFPERGSFTNDPVSTACGRYINALEFSMKERIAAMKAVRLAAKKTSTSASFANRQAATKAIILIRAYIESSGMAVDTDLKAKMNAIDGFYSNAVCTGVKEAKRLMELECSGGTK